MEIVRLLLERGAQPNMARKVGYLHKPYIDLVTCGFVIYVDYECDVLVMGCVCMTNQM